jgi:hypothetical protein
MNSWLVNSGFSLRAAAYSLLVALALSTPAWAQDGAPERPKASWVMSYVFVFVCVGLGLFMVCRGTKRFK